LPFFKIPVEGLANYDALMTLTNLASVSDSVRKRILKERALPRIEEFWFDPSHEELRAASAELLLNLLYSEEYFKEVVKVSEASQCVIFPQSFVFFFSFSPGRTEPKYGSYIVMKATTD
jgi:hypothetical protein